MKLKALLNILIICIIFIACTHAKNDFVDAGLPTSFFKENFENVKKAVYAPGSDTLFTGIWYLDNAVIGDLPADGKNGRKAVRLKGVGSIAMQFDVKANPIQEVSFSCARFNSNDKSSKLALYISSDAGVTWNMIGDTILCADPILREVTYKNLTLQSENVRFKIQNFTTDYRVDIDDFKIAAYASYQGPRPKLPIDPAAPTRDDPLAMGNPSNAAANPADSNNFLVGKGIYTLSYNNSKGTPNWVAWHLSSAWVGSLDRCDCFSPDNALPTGYKKITTADYTGSGFDRGHMCPSGDRTSSSPENSLTFLMPNILPQSADNNQGPWEKLESYCRTLAQTGNELYIISGGYGKGGVSLFGIKDTIAGGKIQVPAHIWKVIVVLPIGDKDISRVTATTRVIAVDMPNIQGIKAKNWGDYRVTTRTIEDSTHYKFLSTLPIPVQNTIKATKDAGPTM